MKKLIMLMDINGSGNKSLFVARDKEADVCVLYEDMPIRVNDKHWEPRQRNCDGFYVGEIGILPPYMFPDLKWEDEPIEVLLVHISSLIEEPQENTITLTHYYVDYDKEHEWFVNMLKHQVRYKDCTDEEIEELWKNHIKEEYTPDEIWDTIQCDGYTKIVLRMGRHDKQPDYDYVLETKEYIDNKLKDF